MPWPTWVSSRTGSRRKRSSRVALVDAVGHGLAGADGALADDLALTVHVHVAVAIDVHVAVAVLVLLADARQERQDQQRGGGDAEGQLHRAVRGEDAEDVGAVDQRDHRGGAEHEADDDRHRLGAPVQRGAEEQERACTSDEHVGPAVALETEERLAVDRAVDGRRGEAVAAEEQGEQAVGQHREADEGDRGPWPGRRPCGARGTCPS
jgi:hypothetical protein